MVNEKLVYNPNAQSLPTDSTAIVNKLNNGELAVKGKNKSQKKRRLAVAKNVITELNKIADAEGAVEAPMDKGESMVKAEVVKEKAKPKPEKGAATLQYPLDARINGYNFLRLSNALLADLGWHVDMALKVDKNADGSIMLRKA
jgi:hypothetical protein